MDEKITFIPFSQLLIIFIPAGMVVFILRSWSLEWINSFYAIGRMLIQLIIIAYFLTFLFSTNNSLITLFILVSMVFIASWIALGTVSKDRTKLLKTVFISILFGGGVTLLLVTQFAVSYTHLTLPTKA